MVHNVLTWVGSHLGAVIAASSLGTGFVVAKLHTYLTAYIEKEERVFLTTALSYCTRPEDQVAFKAVLHAISVRFPEAGNALFSEAADSIIRRVPTLAPFRQDIIMLLIQIEQALKKGLDAEAS